MSNTKVSILFFDDREVRAVWDEQHSKWWFSVLDIVAVLTDQNDYAKTRNYWKYLKAKLKREGNQLVSATTQLKLKAADGKKYLTDTLDSDGIVELAKHMPNNRAMNFLDWFLYSENSIDGQSKKKAYALFESNLIDEIVAKYIEMNIAHPFMEGNGRSTRIWLDLILKKRLKRCVDWSKIGKYDYMSAMVKSSVDSSILHSLLQNALTTEIDSRDMYLKGIDYSYYYEQED